MAALAACGAPEHPHPHGGHAAAGDPAASAAPVGPALGCRLPAPKKSDDACTNDADCGVSEPCHAKACVARAKSHPATPDTMCTRSLECHTADANKCGCFEGKCALIPGGHASVP